MKQLLSHVIAEREVTLLQGQFKLFQIEQVPDCWFMEKYGNLKCIDMHWAKVFAICNAEREREKLHLLKVIKSCLSLQNSNGSVERTPSDNKNTLRPKGSSLSDESLMSLRRMKEHTCKCTGAENVNNLDKGILKRCFSFFSL